MKAPVATASSLVRRHLARREFRDGRVVYLAA